jgi:hypothetical protein
MSTTKPKFDPSRVASLLNRGDEEGRAVLPGPTPASPVLSSVPPPANAGAGDLPAPEPETGAAKKPITIRLSEEVLHALLRHQAEVRCKPGARLGDTTIGGCVDTLLRGALRL